MRTKERTKQDSGGREHSSYVGRRREPTALELPCCGQKQGVREVEEDDTALI